MRTLLVLLTTALVAAGPVFAETELKVVMHSDLKLLDPIWSGGYITCNHGYMIYDTLFATDAVGQIRPQMVDRYDVSADKLTYTFTLREGLLWHDGKAVAAEDCVASLKRWGGRDSMGQKLMAFVKDMVVVDARTFRMIPKEPTGLVLPALGKPSTYVPFMMPKRVAETSVNDQLTDTTGSGPFVFKSAEWKPGDKVIYTRFAQYRPRPEPPSGLAGGKVVRRRQNNAHAIRAFHDVIVGDDVAVRLDDDAGADSAFASNGTRCVLVIVGGRSVASHSHFYDGGRNVKGPY
jgi:peptide/nickel transport system substrate-binding protein